MYAVVEIGGKQYRVENGQSLLVDRLSQDVGAKVPLKPLLYRPDKGELVASGSALGKVKVEAKVVEHLRGEKLTVFKYKPKHGYRRKTGHRSELTRIDITGIKAGSSTAAKTTAEKPAMAKKETAAKKAPAKKPAAKTAATKPAAKPAAKKPPAKKAAAKKPAKKTPTKPKKEGGE